MFAIPLVKKSRPLIESGRPCKAIPVGEGYSSLVTARSGTGIRSMPCKAFSDASPDVPSMTNPLPWKAFDCGTFLPLVFLAAGNVLGLQSNHIPSMFHAYTMHSLPCSAGAFLLLARFRSHAHTCIYTQ